MNIFLELGQVIGQGGLTSRQHERRYAGPGPVAEQRCWTVRRGEEAVGHEGQEVDKPEASIAGDTADILHL